MAGLGTQPAIERAGLVTPRLPVRAPRIYPNNPVRAKGEPTQPVASLATVAVTSPAKRRHASVWAVGNAASKIATIPDAEGARKPEGDEGLSVIWARAGFYPAGCTTTARTKEDDPVTWEALILPRKVPVQRRPGDHSPRLGTSAGAGTSRQEQAPAAR